MSDAEPIRIPVDVTNPGQFFACCGLLELTSRLDDSALGRFEADHFCLHTSATDVLDKFFKCPVEAIRASASFDDDDDGEEAGEDEDPHRGRVYPMRLAAPFNLLLNWWTDDDARGQKLKLWTAGQRVTDLLLGHHKYKKKRVKGKPVETVPIYTPSTREHFADVVKKHPRDWLRVGIPIGAPAAFSFDSRLSRNNALDLGYASKRTFAFSPAIDVLCLVGLQRFRPEMIEVWNRNRYCTWREKLPVAVAPLAVLGLVPSLVDRCFEFPIKARDSQGRFKLFGHAQPARRPDV
jgi:hypothetical protein